MLVCYRWRGRVGVRRTEATERRRAAVRPSPRRVPDIDHVTRTVHRRRRFRRRGRTRRLGRRRTGIGGLDLDRSVTL